MPWNVLVISMLGKEKQEDPWANSRPEKGWKKEKGG